MIGKPKTKDEAELVWSARKRAIMARVNFEAQVWRERELNERLDTAWKEFLEEIGNDELNVLAADDELKKLGPRRD